MPPRLRTLLLAASVMLVLADSSVVTLALPDILRRFDIEITDVAGVLTAYNGVLAVVAMPAAWAARRRPRATLAIGLVIFASASAACALAGGFTVLVDFVFTWVVSRLT